MTSIKISNLNQKNRGKLKGIPREQWSDVIARGVQYAQDSTVSTSDMRKAVRALKPSEPAHNEFVQKILENPTEETRAALRIAGLLRNYTLISEEDRGPLLRQVTLEQYRDDTQDFGLQIPWEQIAEVAQVHGKKVRAVEAVDDEDEDF